MGGDATLREGEQIAAVDLGSNSFHLLVARYEQGEPRVLDRLREPVRLALGVRPDGSLDAERHKRALSCLARFGQRLRALRTGRVRAVATQAVRQMQASRAFLMTAETALGHPIEVVSGREEARLIYLGVAHSLPASRTRRLVVDIGGGSTEFIIGEGLKALETESVGVGCVASTVRFFPDGKLTAKRWQRAETEISVELQQFAPTYRTRGFREAIGSSGTMRALASIGQALDISDRVITPAVLERIRERVLDAGQVDRLELPGLSEDRRPVFAGGLLVALCVFRALGLERMKVSEAAMREGVLYDMVGRAEHRDPREASVDAMAQRYGTDKAQAARVLASCEALYAETAILWELGDPAHDWLRWAAKLHEVGLAIAHSQYHVHGGYLAGHSDLPGFAREEQQVLAFLIGTHRRAIAPADLQALPDRMQRPAARLLVLLRLAVLLNRSRSEDAIAPLGVEAGERQLRLRFPHGGLDAHPLTRADLDSERKHLAALGIKLVLAQ